MRNLLPADTAEPGLSCGCAVPRDARRRVRRRSARGSGMVTPSRSPVNRLRAGGEPDRPKPVILRVRPAAGPPGRASCGRARRCRPGRSGPSARPPARTELKSRCPRVAACAANPKIAPHSAPIARPAAPTPSQVCPAVKSPSRMPIRRPIHIPLSAPAAAARALVIRPVTRSISRRSLPTISSFSTGKPVLRLVPAPVRLAYMSSVPRPPPTSPAPHEARPLVSWPIPRPPAGAMAGPGVTARQRAGEHGKNEAPEIPGNY